MALPAKSAGLTITNPLILYRGLVATKKIRPDPAQHRLALHLQKLYYRLKDYDPEIEYRQRLDQISRSTSHRPQIRVEEGQPSSPKRGLLSSLWGRDGSSLGPVLSLTRTVPVHESAMTIESPQGMLLYGEVGRGKSMLLDLLADCLPSKKKRRWHFNAFMLDTFRRLELLRKERLDLPASLRGLEQEHSVLTLARDMIMTSPILFLDEFQLPDRTASKLLSSFLTSFFHLGGVLIATSNRMPEELAKAAGVEFMPEPRSRLDSFSTILGYRRKREESEKAAATDFGAFLEVLKARCEIWEMEGERDWRREHMPVGMGLDNSEEDFDDNLASASSTESSVSSASSIPEARDVTTPNHYYVVPPQPSEVSTIEIEASWIAAINNTDPTKNARRPMNTATDWQPSLLHVYGRQIPVPAQASGTTKWDFSSLCGSTLGPADYITLASTYHTLILDNVPILTSLLKNEARRFITLLDALYESRCRLLIRADAAPDYLFFPETKSMNSNGSGPIDSDNVYQETFAEIYQDSTSPFRPNISSYTEGVAGTPSLLSPDRRSVLADEDADFGPVYGNGRGHGASNGNIMDIERRQGMSGPDFTRTALMTGDDERFAYKRARSRLWEMCGEKWWEERKGNVDEWWKPIGKDVRHWEDRVQDAVVAQHAIAEEVIGNASGKSGGEEVDERQDGLFRHGASPFRTMQDPPPKFSWVHAWGMMQWGKKAGVWGKGVDARKKRERNAGAGEQSGQD